MDTEEDQPEEGAVIKAERGECFSKCKMVSNMLHAAQTLSRGLKSNSILQH